MSQTVGDFIVSRLHEWGVTRCYGYSGDGINGVMAGLRRAENGPRLIQPRHEELASFMASAHAKFTGTPGVCISTSGPGAIHLLNGLYDAKKDHVPAVAIVGQQSRMSLGTDYQQEIDLISLYKDVADDYVHMVSRPASGAPSRGPGHAHRHRPTHGDRDHRACRCTGCTDGRAAGRARRDVLGHRLRPPGRDPGGGGSRRCGEDS